MKINQKRILNVTVILIFIFACSVSMRMNQITLESLNFHTRDYVYYVQFAAKVFDSGLSPRFALNPNGYNFLGFYGMDGFPTLHDDIHFSLIKYIMGGLYFLFKSPNILFLFYSIIYFFPILYLIKSFPVPKKSDKLFLLLIILAYCAYPSTFFATSFDLRTYILLGPLLVISLVSVELNKSKWEMFCFFNLLFLIREEALIFGFIIILYGFVRNYVDNDVEKLDQKKSIWANIRWKYRNLIPLVYSYLFWAFMTGNYFYNWTNFPRQQQEDSLIGKIISLIAPQLSYFIFTVILTLVILFYLFTHKKKILKPLTFSLIILPLTWFFYQKTSDYFLDSNYKDIIYRFIYVPRYTINFLCILILFIVLWRTFKGKICQYSLLGTLILIVTTSTFFSVTKKFPASPVNQHNKYLEQIKNTDIIFSFRDSLNPYSSFVLCDYDTYQAFYNFENVYVYNRLPGFLLPEKISPNYDEYAIQRYYPQNTKILLDLLKSKIEYIAISKDSLNIINDLLEKEGLKEQAKVMYENKKYLVYQLRIQSSFPHSHNLLTRIF